MLLGFLLFSFLPSLSQRKTLAHEIAYPENDILFSGYVRQSVPNVPGVNLTGITFTHCPTNPALRTSLVKLRGWIKRNGNLDAGEHEMKYTFEPDITWVKAMGIDLKNILHAGNALLSYYEGVGALSNGTGNCIAVSPEIHVELVGWNQTEGWGHTKKIAGGLQPCIKPPVRWESSEQASIERSTQLSQPKQIILFPYDPYQYEERTYIEIEGSLIADNIHCDKSKNVEYLKTANAWGKTNNCEIRTPNFWDQSRWIEIHPPNKMTTISPPSEQYSQYLISAIAPYEAITHEFNFAPITSRPQTVSPDHILEIDYVLDVIVQEGSVNSPKISTDLNNSKLKVRFDQHHDGTQGQEWKDCPRFLAVLTVKGWKEILVKDPPPNCDVEKKKVKSLEIAIRNAQNQLQNAPPSEKGKLMEKITKLEDKLSGAQAALTECLSN